MAFLKPSCESPLDVRVENFVRMMEKIQLVNDWSDKNMVLVTRFIWKESLRKFISSLFRVGTRSIIDTKFYRTTQSRFLRNIWMKSHYL